MCVMKLVSTKKALMLGILVPSHDLLMMMVLRLGPWYLSRGGGGVENHSPFSQRSFWVCTYLDEQLDAWSLLKLGRRLKGHIPSPKVSSFVCWTEKYKWSEAANYPKNKRRDSKTQFVCASHPFFKHLYKEAKFWPSDMILGSAIGTAPAVPANQIIYQCHLGGWMWIVCWLQKFHVNSFVQSTQKWMWLVSPQVKFAGSATVLGCTKSNYDTLVMNLET